MTTCRKCGADVDVLRRVRELRRESPYAPLPLKTAVEIARYERADHIGRHAFLEDLGQYGRDTARGDVDGFSVVVTIEPDYDRARRWQE